MERYHFNPGSRKSPISAWQRLVLPVALVCGLGVTIGVISLWSKNPSEPADYDVHIETNYVEPSGERTLSFADANDQDREDSGPEFNVFERCAAVRDTCVVDGDTFWLDSVKIRIADIDTPEISQPQCDYEKALGEKATERLIQLLNAGPFELQTIGGRDIDRYGRLLRVVVRDGSSLGDQLVAEGLARTWTGRREPWC